MTLETGHMPVWKGNTSMWFTITWPSDGSCWFTWPKHKGTRPCSEPVRIKFQIRTYRGFHMA